MIAIAEQPEVQGIATEIGVGSSIATNTSSAYSIDTHAGGYAMAPLDSVKNSDDFAEFALTDVIDAAHATSSCRMGRPNDPRCVVDPELRVLGLSGLRLADASVLPWVPRANPHLSAVLAGERVADLIRASSGR
jgi:choline dehydrogenase